MADFIILLLIAAIHTVLGMLIGIKLQKRHHTRRLEIYKSEARTDALTGSLNRRGFDDVIPFRLEDARRDEKPLSLLFVDIDRFKSINDGMGHESGDRVLIVLATTMREQLRDSDAIARLGGDEFVVLLQSTNLQQANLVAERIRQAIDGRDRSPDTADHRFTISVGVAEASRGEGIDELLKRADAAAYASKENGRNRCSFHDGEQCQPVIAPL